MVCGTELLFKLKAVHLGLQKQTRISPHKKLIWRLINFHWLSVMEKLYDSFINTQSLTWSSSFLISLQSCRRLTVSSDVRSFISFESLVHGKRTATCAPSTFNTRPAKRGSVICNIRGSIICNINWFRSSKLKIQFYRKWDDTSQVPSLLTKGRQSW